MEEGHLLPTFGLAHSLKRRGHEVHYLSILDNEELITEQGFRFHYLLENLYPKGFRQLFKNNYLLPENEQVITPGYIVSHYVQSLINGAYDAFINEIKADLFIVSYYMPFDILFLYYKYGIRSVIFSTTIHKADKTIFSDCLYYVTEMNIEEKFSLLNLLAEKNIHPANLEEVAEPLNGFTQLVLCPGEFEIGEPVTQPNMHYVESSIRAGTGVRDIFSTYRIPASKKILYASMGSQALRHKDAADLFFNKILRIMDQPALEEVHLILNVNAEYDQKKLVIIPGNVTILEWAPQIDILQVASAAIIHGGLGSVKECIYFGVPMIVFPQGHDQPANARRIVYHQLGFADDINTVTENELQSYILSVLKDDGIQRGIQAMKKVFRQKEEDETGASIIESVLERQERKFSLLSP